MVGGLITTYLALTLLSERFGYEDNFLISFSILKEQADSHFHMIFSSDHPYYKDLPGLSVLIGGMWINNLSYWGCNQYIIQRALGADLKTARSGILFAAFLKLLIPVIAVLPGIAMYVLYSQGLFQEEMVNENGVLKPDHAYPTLMNLLPSGLKGIAFAALTAAIVASLAGKANSISTIFSLDIYKKFINKNASEKRIVNIGKWSVIVSMLLAGIVAPSLRSLEQAYQFIQEYVGFISPGVLAIFLLGLYWKKTTTTAALVGTLLTIPLSTILKFLPQWTNNYFPDYPFLDRMTITFVFIVFTLVIISLSNGKNKKPLDTIEIDKSSFLVSSTFLFGSIIILGILVALYTVFW
jgi:SSS family solute:Na+ symporter